MYISKTGGIIGAASIKRARPLRQTGSIPAARRIVLTMQQAGIFPVVVITGAEEDELRYQLTKDYVIFLAADDPEELPLFESVKIGLEYLFDKCEDVIFTPVNAPMFTAETILRLMKEEAEVVTPAFQGVSGHPVLIRDSAKKDIMDYDGDNGLRGAIHRIGDRRKRVQVDDPGILSLNQSDEGLNDQVPLHNQSLLHPSIQISLGTDNMFFNDRLKLLLFLIGDMKNVKLACEAMAISKGKAWNMINALEERLGFSVVARQQGGKQGGRTALTPEGEDFLLRWQKYEEEVYQFSQDRYKDIFRFSQDR